MAATPPITGYPYQGTHAPGATTAPSWQSDNAVDIPLTIGTPLYAPGAGTVASTHYQTGTYTQGWTVTLNALSDSFFYGHLSKVVVQPGQKVQAGQLIGYSGSANGVAHLHLAERNRAPTNLGGLGKSGPGTWYGPVLSLIVSPIAAALNTFDKIIAALKGKKTSKAQAQTAAEALLAAGKKPSPDQMSALVSAGIATSSVQSSLPGYHTVVGAKNAVSGAFSGMEDAWKWISDPANILRIGEVMAGGLMLGIGLLMLARTTSQTETVQSVGGAVSMAKAAVT